MGLLECGAQSLPCQGWFLAPCDAALCGVLKVHHRDLVLNFPVRCRPFHGFMIRKTSPNFTSDPLERIHARRPRWVPYRCEATPMYRAIHDLFGYILPMDTTCRRVSRLSGTVSSRGPVMASPPGVELVREKTDDGEHRKFIILMPCSDSEQWLTSRDRYCHNIGPVEVLRSWQALLKAKKVDVASWDRALEAASVHQS